MKQLIEDYKRRLQKATFSSNPKEWPKIELYREFISELERLSPEKNNINSSIEQNERMKIWFEQRTGLKEALLWEHMKKIDSMLKNHKLPIELPTDNDIDLYAFENFNQIDNYPGTLTDGCFIEGAKWMRDHIKSKMK